MCQARTSRYFSGVLVWTILGSLIFGFCSIWSLHFVATLACGLDLQIGLNVPLTILSAVLAVGFTFCALGGELIRKNHRRTRRKRRHARKQTRSPCASRNNSEVGQLLRVSEDPALHQGDLAKSPRFTQQSPVGSVTENVASPSTPKRPFLTTHQPYHFPGKPPAFSPEDPAAESDAGSDIDSAIMRSSENTSSEHTSSFTGSTSTTRQLGMGKLMSVRTRRQTSNTDSNAFIATSRTLVKGLTIRNLTEAFVWTMAVTGMHYVGIYALEIPDGYITLNPWLVALSVFVGFTVCVIALSLFGEMETNLARQVLFSVVASVGVAAKHFTGMAATTFHTGRPPTEKRGYPQGLAASIVAVAVITCIIANGLLAHSATVSRDKLAEVFYTRKKMWQAIAQKENAESAAQARSDFIASASHEIRTPLHQLQGYSDLLSRTELTDEGRILLYAIQHATKTLSLITTNVLDWSRLEKHGDTRACQPVALDMRQVCEAVINLLPNKDEENEAEILVVVAPDVPHSLFADETYTHRILMNLLSNAIKFTSSGYVLLLIEMKEGRLVATVRDTGCGIPPAFLPRLFEPFTQAETLGAHRGTGLGLSIIKQLLAKMGGDIVVESKYEATVGINHSGSQFVATIPVPLPYEVPSAPYSIPKIAMFHDRNDRYLNGVREAWKQYGTEMILVNDKMEATNFKHIWIDISMLQRRPDLYSWLAHEQQKLVLVTYETQLALDYVFGMVATQKHFITLRKPLIWHSILHAVALAEAGTKASPEKSVRFAPEIDLMDQPEEIAPMTILLVEDNKINLRLMQKMLTTLKYSVLIANDGQEAVDQTILHDRTIDAILMDQSMPIKDGLTASKEIRELERDGSLSKRHAIIAVTAVVSSESQSLSEAAGTDDFLAKPVSLVKLGSCLEKWLKRP
jgi:signal transduction histidine kinase/CheY-like chemotaxis protein